MGSKPRLLPVAYLNLAHH